MVIRWTRLAQESLRQVFDFYLPIVGADRARDIVQNILGEAKLLEMSPCIGSVFYIHHKCYRKLVTRRYTLFYEVDGECVYINLVWDNRRNPNTLMTLL